MWKRIAYHFGYALRETGQALDRLGCKFQGDFAFVEQLNRHRRITAIYDKKPWIAQDVFVAASASVMGNVKIGEGSTVWYGTVVRGDVNHVTIGERSSIGNRSVIHCSSPPVGEKAAPDCAGATKIGNNVVVGDGAILHGCTLEDKCVIESGAIVFDGAVVEKEAVVGVGAVVTKGKRVLAGQYWEGNPAKYVRDVTEQEKELNDELAQRIYWDAKEHEKQTLKSQEEKAKELVLDGHNVGQPPITL